MPLEIRKSGELVEGFRIMAELGRGAASIIYLAQDTKTKQVWALKNVVKDNEKDQRFLDQAEQEYLVASKVDSEKVRKIDRVIRKRESLLGGTNELWLVMEHVDGASCEREPPGNFEDALFVYEQVAQGLSSMHVHGFVHADMKPNNIIVDDKKNAKIIDLGQSCKTGTIKQRIQGTPDYIAPEQVHRRAITPKTDVYNLGAAMYWTFTRKFVPTALAKEDSLGGHLDDKLIPKPTPIRECNPRVPELLADIIMQCVEVDPESRPTMELVADRLNMIRSRIVAQRMNGPRAPATTRAGSGSKSGNGGSSMSGSKSPGGSKGGSSGVGHVFPSNKIPHTPPVDPGPGITDAEDDGPLPMDDNELGPKRM